MFRLKPESQEKYSCHFLQDLIHFQLCNRRFYCDNMAFCALNQAAHAVGVFTQSVEEKTKHECAQSIFED